MPAIRRTPLIEFFWAIHRWLYQKTGGRLGSTILGNAVLLLTTTGRKTGKMRTTALTYLHDDGRLVVIASNAGERRHPAWFLNLMSHPRATAQVGPMVLTVHGREAVGDERERLWSRIVEMDRSYAEYQARTTRQIPVVVLEAVQLDG